MMKAKKDNSSVTLKQRWQKARRRVLVYAAIIALGFASGLYFLSSSQIALLERQAYALKSTLFSIYHQAEFDAARRKIVLLTIDESTLEGKPFNGEVDLPLPRRYHAKVIRELKRLKARGIVFDLFFEKPTPDDAKFAKEARDFRHIVWATFWQKQTADLREEGKIVFPVPVLSKIGSLGHPRMPNSGDSFEDESKPTTDRIEAFVPSDRGELPALSVQAARLLADKDIVRKTGNYLQLGSKKLALDENGEFKIIFSGPPTNAFAPIPYQEVLNGLQNNAALSSGKLFKDSIVFIGDTSEINKDFSFTPNGRMSGLEVHAHALATLLQGDLVHDASGDFNLLVLIATVLVFALASMLVPMRFFLPQFLAFVIGAFVVNCWWLLAKNHNVMLMAPLGAAFVVSLAILAERGWTTEGESRRMGTVLNQYVSPQVGQSGAPQGEVTIVFTDIEGSSMLSERFGIAFEKAREAHFNLLREAARRWNGFEVETAGDSLFVVFSDAADAVRFAIAGQMALKQHRWPSFLREQQIEHKNWSGSDLPVRMGIHTGRPFISRDRNRLTYRGPATNRASRVMGAAHGGQIIMSETAKEKVGDALKSDSEFAEAWFLKRGDYNLKGIGQESLWEVCHAEFFDPPPRPLRDEALEPADLENQLAGLEKKIEETDRQVI